MSTEWLSLRTERTTQDPSSLSRNRLNPICSGSNHETLGVYKTKRYCKWTVCCVDCCRRATMQLQELSQGLKLYVLSLQLEGAS